MRKIIVIVGIVASVTMLWSQARSKPLTVTKDSSESTQYLTALIAGHMPPRFDTFANNGFGDARFTFLHPVKIWLGIPAGLLDLPGMQARSANLLIIIALFLWGLHQIDRIQKTRLLTFSSATATLLIVATLDLVGSDLPITLMTLPWLVWATSRFVKINSLNIKWWSRALSKEGLVLVLVLSFGLLASSAMLALCAGLGLGVLAVAKTSLKKPFILCLFWASANTAWFVLPHYTEQTALIKDEHSGNFIATTFDQKKASDIFDDYPNRTIISPNAAVKIVHKPKHWSENTFTAIVPEKSLLIQKTMYFPGWRVKANDLSVTLENPEDNAGLVAYQLEAGTHLVTSQMTQLTVPRMLGNSLSIVSVAIWAWCMQKAKRTGMTNMQRLIRISVTSKEKLVKIMKKFLLQRSQ